MVSTPMAAICKAPVRPRRAFRDAAERPAGDPGGIDESSVCTRNGAGENVRNFSGIIEILVRRFRREVGPVPLATVGRSSGRTELRPKRREIAPVQCLSGSAEPLWRRYSDEVNGSAKDRETVLDLATVANGSVLA